MVEKVYFLSVTLYLCEIWDIYFLFLFVGKPIRVNKSSQDKKGMEVGANLFVGNLDPDCDEKMLYDTFSAFGTIVNTPKVWKIDLLCV